MLQPSHSTDRAAKLRRGSAEPCLSPLRSGCPRQPDCSAQFTKEPHSAASPVCCLMPLGHMLPLSIFLPIQTSPNSALLKSPHSQARLGLPDCKPCMAHQHSQHYVFLLHKSIINSRTAELQKIGCWLLQEEAMLGAKCLSPWLTLGTNSLPIPASRFLSVNSKLLLSAY